jgi:hypothetical protein
VNTVYIYRFLFTSWAAIGAVVTRHLRGTKTDLCDVHLQTLTVQELLTDSTSQHRSLRLNVCPACYLQAKNLPFQSFGIQGNLPAAWPLATSGTFQKVLQLKTYTCEVSQRHRNTQGKNLTLVFTECTVIIYKYVHLLTSWQKRGRQSPHSRLQNSLVHILKNILLFHIHC